MEKTFEITVVLRNNMGEPILDAYGNIKKKSFASDSPYKIWEFWNKNTVVVKKRKAAAAKRKDAKRTLDHVNTVFAESVEKRKRKTFDDGERA